MLWYKKAQIAPPAPAAGPMQSQPQPQATPVAANPRVEAFKAWLKGQDANLWAQIQQDPNLVNGPMARKYFQQWAQSNPPGSNQVSPAPQGPMQSQPQLGSEQFIGELRTKNPNLWAQLEQIQGTPQYGQLLQRKFQEYQQGKPMEQLASGGLSWYRAANSVDLVSDDGFMDELGEEAFDRPGMGTKPEGDKKMKKKRKGYIGNQVPGHGEDEDIHG